MWDRSAWRVLKPWLMHNQGTQLRLLIGFSLMLITLWAGVGLLGLSAWFISAAALSVVAFDIFLPGAAIRALALLRTVARYFERVKNHDLVLRWQHLWRVRLFGHLLRAPTSLNERFRSAHLLQRLTQDLEAMDDLYLRILGPFAVAALTVLVLGALLCLWSPLLGVLIWLPGGVLLWALSAVVANQLCAESSIELAASETLRAQALDYVRASSELQAWGIEGSGLGPLTAAQTALAKAQRQVRQRIIRLQTMLELFHYGLLLAILTLALWLALMQAFSQPVALLIGFAVLATVDVWQPLAQAVSLWGRTVGAAERIAMIEPPTDSETPQDGLTKSTKGPSIAIKQVPANRSTTNNETISLTVEGGQKLFLFGRSGCGKSTLLYRIAGLLPSTPGTIEINGERSASIYHSSCLLTQHSDIFAASVADNLDLAQAGIADARLWQALEMVELADDIAGYPEQLDTWLGDGGQQLSGGQARRLALARCLLNAAPVILLDEPFNGLGRAQASRIWRNIQPWLASSTVVCVMHQKLPEQSPTEPGIVQQDFELCYDRAPG